MKIINCKTKLFGPVYQWVWQWDTSEKVKCLWKVSGWTDDKCRNLGSAWRCRCPPPLCGFLKATAILEPCSPIYRQRFSPKSPCLAEVFVRIDPKQMEWHISKNAVHYMSAEWTPVVTLQVSLVSSAVICHRVVGRAAGGVQNFLGLAP